MSKELIKRFLDPALDAETAAACFADDGVWIAAEGDEPGTTYRRHEIPALLTKLRGLSEEYASKGVSIEYGEPVEAGERVYLEAAARSAEGVVLSRVIDVFVVRDGKIVLKDVFRKG